MATLVPMSQPSARRPYLSRCPPCRTPQPASRTPRHPSRTSRSWPMRLWLPSGVPPSVQRPPSKNFASGMLNSSGTCTARPLPSPWPGASWPRRRLPTSPAAKNWGATLMPHCRPWTRQRWQRPVPRRLRRLRMPPRRQWRPSRRWTMPRPRPCARRSSPSRGRGRPRPARWRGWRVRPLIRSSAPPRMSRGSSARPVWTGGSTSETRITPRGPARSSCGTRRRSPTGPRTTLSGSTTRLSATWRT
mmetsp:Transcript_37888/g.113169  ORF Transcript_37888/g.113169 Transcript_37888/m.113169 type:complete len:246 (-) Transcript_37888:418-1155(-)